MEEVWITLKKFIPFLWAGVFTTYEPVLWVKLVKAVPWGKNPEEVAPTVRVPLVLSTVIAPSLDSKSNSTVGVPDPTPPSVGPVFTYKNNLPTFPSPKAEAEKLTVTPLPPFSAVAWLSLPVIFWAEILLLIPIL